MCSSWCAYFAPGGALPSTIRLRCGSLHDRPCATESRLLLRENQVTDWTPTEETRRAKLFDRLDPDFYAGIIDIRHARRVGVSKISFKMLSALVVRHYTRGSGSVRSTAVPAGDDKKAALMLVLKKP
ncbi:hypothetical protein CYMTET_47188 [Cymbomonas tetramitiformis]|uniref:Uncharacterized protein n=1 Tax=Cymbomonas tetramitiformis TaxID=36881 RepID=A0AAE0BWL8_9CHLO|nr:hypothetical protein CYMTET_47188 [Cymbomonas tetramitiformis]